MRAAPISKDLGHELAASVSRARPLGRDGAIVDACFGEHFVIYWPLVIGYSAFFPQRQSGLLISQSQKHFLAFRDDSAESNLYAR